MFLKQNGDALRKSVEGTVIYMQNNLAALYDVSKYRWFEKIIIELVHYYLMNEQALGIL